MSFRAAVSRPGHPAIREYARMRTQNVQDRIADHITAFAGSMPFVYVHIALFTVWMLVLEQRPWATLTLIVSLEAIFLSTFVMISQNRADAKRQALADHQWEVVQAEEQQNAELLDLSHQILDLTRAVHQLTLLHTNPPVPTAQLGISPRAHGQDD